MSKEAVEEVIDPTGADDGLGEEVAVENEAGAAEGAVTEEADKGAAADSEEVVVTIGEEQAGEEPERAPDWVRDLRRRQRETAKENRELRARLEEMQTGPTASGPGPRPTLEGHDYDTARYESALSEWYDKKREADQAEAAANAKREEEESAWRGRLQAYAEAKTELKVQDYDEAEAIAQDALNQVQQGLIVQGADNPALVIYALGRNPKQLEKLSALGDPVKFAFAVAKLEAQLKIGPRKPATQPEKTPTGTGKISGAVDSTLERLRIEAQKTGDYTKVTAYRRSKRKA